MSVIRHSLGAPFLCRRWGTAVATGALTALLAGCGGSAIEEAPDSDVAVSGAVPTGAATAVPDGRPAAEVPATAGEGGASAGAGGGAGAAPGAGVGGGATADRGGGDASKGSDKAGGGKAAAGAGSAAEAVVRSHPIFGGAAPCKPASLSEVPIGNVSTLSGVLGELLSPAQSALEVFVAAQNACGGLNGHRIKLYVDDDQGDPSTASSKVQAMIQSKKVLAFVGNIQLLTVDAVVPVIRRHGIPMIGGDLGSNTWFENPLLFPQGPPPAAIAHGYLKGAIEHFKTRNVGDMWCIEIPRGCEQNDRAFKELAPELGATVKKSIQASLTSPSYVQQCLDFKNSGTEALALIMDAASMVRMARSCTQVGYSPKLMPTPMGVGNQKQFLTGNKWLGGSYLALNYFPWFADQTAAQKYWQASVRKYNPGFDMGNAASAGWTAGALLVAAAAELSPTNPTTAQLLQGLYAFKGQPWTGLGGLSGPRTFVDGGPPKVPYCLFAAVSNAENTGWASSVNTPQCTDVLAPSDPQRRN